jgi:PAS domain S-box-containing protein
VSSGVEETSLLPRGKAIAPERRLAIQHAAVSALAESGSLTEAVPRLLEAVGTGIGWDFGALWMPNGRDALRCIQTWSSGAIDSRAFEEASLEIELDRGTGLPGRVWASGEPGWITDVTRDPNFPRAPAAKRSGLHSGFAFPVVRGDRVLGVLEFLSHKIREPDQALLADFAIFGFQMGQFIERELVQRELRESRDQLDALLSSVPAGIMVFDQDATIVFANDTAAELAGYASIDKLIGMDGREVLADWETFDEHGNPVPDEDLPGLKALSGIESPAVLLRIGEADGEDRWLIDRATPVPDGRGGLLAVSVFEEISEVKRTEAALRESEARHRAISRTLQEGLAPPGAPEVAGMQVAVRFRAHGEASELGGDFYDLFETGEGRWGVLIGDVSGKGVEAAAVAALARHTVRATAQHNDDPEYVLPMLNEAVGRQLRASRFCTAVYATMEPGELWVRMRIASAGHPAPLLVRGHGGAEEVGSHGPLLAGFHDSSYDAEPAHLAAGESLVLFTDGVIEAGAREGEGEGAGLDAARLSQLLGACVGLDAEGIAQRIEDAVIEAEGGRPRDDAAIVVLRALP